MSRDGIAEEINVDAALLRLLQQLLVGDLRIAIRPRRGLIRRSVELSASKIAAQCCGEQRRDELHQAHLNSSLYLTDGRSALAFMEAIVH